jgi:phenylalanyl-tRNA synthetase alpha chain
MPYTVPKLTDFSTAALDSAVQELKLAFEQEAAAIIELSRSADLNVVQKGNASDDFRNRWQARKTGIAAQVNDLWLRCAPSDAKRSVGQAVNQVRFWLESNVADVEKTSNILRGQSPATRVTAERLDITLPGIRRPLGAQHPVIKTMNEIVGVFRNLGYSVEEGPEVETDYYNFEALNFPPNHPARDTQDTLFIAGQESKPLRDRLLLRTHTSPVQIHAMQKMKPPVRVVCPGKVHRNDALDATHSPIFHQVEGLAVDTSITFCDLKGTLDHAMKALFGSSVKTRFYPSFFPFTEPSADVQISCIFCDGKGVRDGAPCRNCKASGWIELLGCGMVDPNVYGFVDYDPAKLSGFAFGMGVERIAILKYGVDDIQLFFQGDVRFLEQFG